MLVQNHHYTIKSDSIVISDKREIMLDAGDLKDSLDKKILPRNHFINPENSLS